MKIGIDARLIQESGVGRYIRNLIRELHVVDTKNQYVIFLRKDAFDEFVVPNSRWEKRCANPRWHTIAEQYVMPWIFYKEHLDLLHVPYFNAPIMYPGKYILTIHDLTIRHYNTGLASTYPALFYQLRRIGYEVVLLLGIRRAKHIIAVSHTVKKEIQHDFSIPDSKITVTYEGVDPSFLSFKKGASVIKDKYFLYVGNAYPHKNLDTLLLGYKRYSTKVQSPAKLVLVGKHDYFYARLSTTIKRLHLTDSVILFGQADDRKLHALYSHAIAFVFPSRMEGFGLPALEALALGCPVVCSDIPIFHELLKDNAMYVNTLDADAISHALCQMHQKRPSIIVPSLHNWQQMAKTTLAVYHKVTSS